MVQIAVLAKANTLTFICAISFLSFAERGLNLSKNIVSLWIVNAAFLK